MKVIVFTATCLFSFANAQEIKHKILPGSLHTGGDITIVVLNERQNDFDARISYKITPRALVPVPREYQTGTFQETLPIEFLDERGYQTLASDGPTIHQGATLSFMALENVDDYHDAYHVMLQPRSSDWTLEAWYHPTVLSTGWVKLALELQVPLVGRYKIFSRLID